MRRLLVGLGAVAGLTLGVITSGALSAPPAHAEGLPGVDVNSTLEVVVNAADTTTNAALDAAAQAEINQQSEPAQTSTEPVSQGSDAVLEAAIDTTVAVDQPAQSQDSTAHARGAAASNDPEVVTADANAGAHVQVDLSGKSEEPTVDANVCLGLGLFGAGAGASCATEQPSKDGVAEVTTESQVDVELPVGNDDNDDTHLSSDVCLDAAVLSQSDNECATSDQPGNIPASDGLFDASATAAIEGAVDPGEQAPPLDLGVVACLDASVLGDSENGCTGGEDHGLIDAGSTAALQSTLDLGENAPEADLNVNGDVCLDASVLGSGENGCGDSTGGLVDAGSTLAFAGGAELDDDTAIDLAGDTCLHLGVLNATGGSCSEAPGTDNPGDENPDAGEPDLGSGGATAGIEVSAGSSPGGGVSDGANTASGSAGVSGGANAGNGTTGNISIGVISGGILQDGDTPSRGATGDGAVETVQAGQASRDSSRASGVPALFVPASGDIAARAAAAIAAPSATNARGIMPNTGHPSTRLMTASPGRWWLVLLIVGLTNVLAGAFVLRRFRRQHAQPSSG